MYNATATTEFYAGAKAVRNTVGQTVTHDLSTGTAEVGLVCSTIKTDGQCFFAAEPPVCFGGNPFIIGAKKDVC